MKAVGKSLVVGPSNPTSTPLQQRALSDTACTARIIASAAEAGLPDIYQWPEYAHEGALIAYGPSIEGFYRQAARLIAKLFRGAKPADLPVEQPTAFGLAINLKTTATLGLTVPPSLLARADEVIE